MPPGTPSSTVRLSVLFTFAFPDELLQDVTTSVATARTTTVPQSKSPVCARLFVFMKSFCRPHSTADRINSNGKSPAQVLYLGLVRFLSLLFGGSRGRSPAGQDL